MSPGAIAQTNTPTLTVTMTSTPAPVTVELTPDVALSNATQAPGAANVPVSEPFIINLYGQQPVTWTALTVTASGTGNTAGITSLQVYLDNDYSGTVDAGDTLLGAGTFSGSTATIPLSYILSPDGFGSFLVVANFSSSAVTGTYAFNITGMTGSSNLPVAFTGLPFAGVTITIPGPTPTVTNTRTISSTPTSTLTSTITLTATVTNTPSGTWYATPWTNTPIPPNSYTPTPIFTYTPTPGWFNVALGPNSPTFNNPLLVGTSNLPVIQVVLRNDSGYSATLTGLTFTDTGSGTPSSGIDSFQLYNDLNGNGIVDNGEPLLGAASFTGSTATFSFTQNLAAATGSVTLLAVAEFASTGSTGTYTFSVTGGSGFNGLGGPEGFSNLPATGAPITITYPTPTLTSTNSYTPTATTSATPSPTSTPTNLGGFTSTPTPCVPVLQSSYTFDTGTECWRTWGGPVGSVLQWDSVDGHTNPGSLEAILPYTSGSVSQALIFLDLSSAPP